MRLKSRRIKLKSQNSINKKTIVIASIAVLLVALVIALAIGASLIVKNIQVEHGNAIKSIMVSETPKTKYNIGESANYDGLVIEVRRNNNTVEYIKYTDNPYLFEITGFDSSQKAETQQITIKYEDQYCTFHVSINEQVQPNATLVGISMAALPKTEYKIGERLNVEGGLIRREYADGTTKTIILSKSNISGWEEAYEAGPGTYTLTVRYEENGIVKKTTFEITITK